MTFKSTPGFIHSHTNSCIHASNTKHNNSLKNRTSGLMTKKRKRRRRRKKKRRGRGQIVILEELARLDNSIRAKKSPRAKVGREGEEEKEEALGLSARCVSSAKKHSK